MLPASALPADPAAHRLLYRRHAGVRPVLFPDFFEGPAWTALGQQITLSVAVQLKHVLCQRYGQRIEGVSGPVLVFPDPGDIAWAPVDDLRALHLSGMKANALIGATRAIDAGWNPATLNRMPVSEAQRLLEKVRGIGPWTAAYVLLRVVGQPDILPAGYVGLQARGPSHLDSRAWMRTRCRKQPRLGRNGGAIFNGSVAQDPDRVASFNSGNMRARCAVETGGASLPEPSDESRPWAMAILTVVLGVILYIGVHIMWNDLGILPLAGHLIDGSIALVVGLTLSSVFERMVKARPRDIRGLTMIRMLVRLAIYSLTAIVVLGSLGVTFGHLALGGATVAIILGLAGQTVLSNLMAGVLLAIWRPFEVGDHVTVMAWQYSMMPPTFPHEATPPGHSGRIVDLDVMYTKLVTDDGVPMVVPNGIMVTAAILNRARAGAFLHRWRFDVSLDIDPQAALEAVRDAVKRAADTCGVNPGSWGAQVEVADVGPSTFSILVGYKAHASNAPRIRAEIVREAALGLRALRANAGA